MSQFFRPLSGPRLPGYGSLCFLMACLPFRSPALALDVPPLACSLALCPLDSLVHDWSTLLNPGVAPLAAIPSVLYGSRVASAPLGAASPLCPVSAHSPSCFPCLTCQCPGSHLLLGQDGDSRPWAKRQHTAGFIQTAMGSSLKYF